MEGRNSNKRITSIAIALLIILVVSFLAYRYIDIYEKTQIWNTLDIARDAYSKDIKTADVYEKKDDDYVENIEIESVYDDRDMSANWYHTNLENVNITVNDSIENLKMKQRCIIFLGIINEIDSVLDNRFEDSTYYQLYRKNQGMTSMQYRGISLFADHETEFTFVTSENTYSFKYINSMTVTNKKTGDKDFYDYYEKDGELEAFENRYKHGNSSSGNKYSSSSSVSKNSSSSSGKRRYDYYDVDEYDSAQDFADDKYEEFYDYEDDYEDEDEAYDAAEDYWNEYH